jgi:hypothetical protein
MMHYARCPLRRDVADRFMEGVDQELGSEPSIGPLLRLPHRSLVDQESDSRRIQPEGESKGDDAEADLWTCIMSSGL